MPFSLGQPGRFGDHSQGRGLCDRRWQPGQAVHKILGYDPIQKSFSAPKYVIRAKNPRLHRITVTEHGFLLLEWSSAQWGATLAGSSSSHQVVEVEEVRAESEEQVAELGQSEDEFGAFDQADLFEDPFGDLGDPSLTKANLQEISSHRPSWPDWKPAGEGYAGEVTA